MLTPRFDGKWVYAYVADGNTIIAPVVINSDAFPIGIVIYDSLEFVARRLRVEREFAKNAGPVDCDAPHRRVEGYRLGDSLDTGVYLRAALHMFRQAIRLTPLRKIADVAEGEFRKCIVFVNPPTLQLADQTVLGLRKEGRAIALTDFEDVDVEEIVKWNPA